jgi:hypothetical protein
MAVAGAIGAVAPAANAVNLADDGLGEVLIFPYYTVRNGYDTYINITNTSNETVAFKIRFREGYNSRDARDFNVILSPYDVWVAAITESPSGDTARLQTVDKSCTQPQLFQDPGNPDMRFVDFTNLDFISSNEDTGPTSLNRTKEGYAVAIEMGTSDAGNEDIPGTVAYNAKHVNGVPRDCSAIVNQFETNLGGVRVEFDEPNNNLKGTGALIKVDQGKAGGYDTVTLANFFNPGTGSGGAGAGFLDDDAPEDLIFLALDARPNLGDVLPAISVVNIDTDTPLGGFHAGAFPPAAGVAVDIWPAVNRIDAVTAVLNRASAMNQFSVDAGTLAETDHVFTFPTKFFYVDTREKGNGPAIPPFARNFQDDSDGNGVSCDQVVLTLHDREEFEPERESDFSPPPPQGRNEMCYEVNLITFNGNNPLGSELSQNIDLAVNGIETGWLDVGLESDEGGSGPTTMRISTGGPFGGGPATFGGMPVIGFAYTTLENGVAQSNLLNYGSIWDHAYRREYITSGVVAPAQ